MLNKSGTNNINDSIELFDIKNNAIPKNKVNMSNISSSRRRSSFNINDGLFNINLDSLVNQYYSGDFKDLNINKIEKLYSDFKIALKLIEDFKINTVQQNEVTSVSSNRELCEKNEKNQIVSTGVKSQKILNEANINLIDI